MDVKLNGTRPEGAVQDAGEVSWLQQVRPGERRKGALDLRPAWLAIYVEEAELPTVKVATEASNPIEIMKRAFGNCRMKTLRSRARTWARVRDWMIMFAGDPFPRDVSYMLEYLLFLVQEEAPRGRLMDAAAALAVLEEAGQVPSGMRISSMGAWTPGVKPRIAELEQGKTKTKRAPPPSVAMIISLEITVMSLHFPESFRAMAWVILLCTWACLRLSDLEGLDPNRLTLGTRGLRGVLVRTKATAPWSRKAAEGNAHLCFQKGLTNGA